MQDRYKFKIWDKTEKKFLPLYSKTENTDSWISIDNTGVYLVERDNARDVAFFTDITEDVIILQCTGLKDKNGKEIYEGNICEYNFEDIGKQRAIIIFNNKLAGFIAKPITNFQYTELNNCEVIGNIYENSELLKDGE